MSKLFWHILLNFIKVKYVVFKEENERSLLKH